MFLIFKKKYFSWSVSSYRISLNDYNFPRRKIQWNIYYLSIPGINGQTLTAFASTLSSQLFSRNNVNISNYKIFFLVFTPTCNGFFFFFKILPLFEKNISTFSVTDWSCCFSYFNNDVNTHYHLLSESSLKNQKYFHSISEGFINFIFKLCLTFDFTPKLS